MRQRRLAFLYIYIFLTAALKVSLTQSISFVTPARQRLVAFTLSTKQAF